MHYSFFVITINEINYHLTKKYAQHLKKKRNESQQQSGGLSDLSARTPSPFKTKNNSHKKSPELRQSLPKDNKKKRLRHSLFSILPTRFLCLSLTFKFIVAGKLDTVRDLGQMWIWGLCGGAVEPQKKKRRRSSPRIK